MPDHEGSDPTSRSTPRVPEGAVRPPTTPPELDLAAALGGLDRATRNFTRRLGEAQGIAQRAPGPPTPVADQTSQTHQTSQAPRRDQAPSGALSGARAPAPPTPRRTSADDAFEARLREAERDAREYLEHAKQRADSLVAAMVGAVEREATEIRRDAEEGIRARWHQVEVEAGRHLEEASRVGERMVAERQQRLSVLSDGITGKAEAVTAGLDDADRVRVQFEAFVRALSVTADRIAREPAMPGGSRTLADLRNLRRTSRPSAIAA